MKNLRGSMCLVFLRHNKNMTVANVKQILVILKYYIKNLSTSLQMMLSFVNFQGLIEKNNSSLNSVHKQHSVN